MRLLHLQVEGPSRVRLTEEEKNERWKPREKKEVKKREMTADEKLLDQQNKDLGMLAIFQHSRYANHMIDEWTVLQTKRSVHKAMTELDGC